MLWGSLLTTVKWRLIGGRIFAGTTTSSIRTWSKDEARVDGFFVISFNCTDQNVNLFRDYVILSDITRHANNSSNRVLRPSTRLYLNNKILPEVLKRIRKRYLESESNIVQM